MADELLTPAGVAQILKVTPETLRRWREKGEGPPFEQFTDRIIRYSSEGLEGWRAQRRTAVG